MTLFAFYFMENQDTPETNDAQWGTGKVTTDFARRLERERNEARKALRNMLLIVEHGIPEPSHEGSCGPWAACDGNCEARAYCSEYIAEAKNILSNDKDLARRALDSE